MYVCMYACMYACMYVCVYVCMYVCMPVHMKSLWILRVFSVPYFGPHNVGATVVDARGVCAHNVGAPVVGACNDGAHGFGSWRWRLRCWRSRP